MTFGEIPVAEAAGAILAHSVRADGVSLRKGRRLEAEDCRALSAAGVATVVAVRMTAADIGEDEAAAMIAAAILPDHLTFTTPATGRINLHAAVAGLFVADRAAVDRFNGVDPAVTIATLADHVPVEPGAMVATIKIIPLGLPRATAERAASVLAERNILAVKPFAPHRVGLVATALATLKPSVMDKTRRLLEHRLAPSGSAVTDEVRVDHRAASLAAVLPQAARENDLVVVFGASAVADVEDVIPAAIRAAGGVVDHVGMPVDPGNLLVLGRIGDVPVIGAPGCARSPKENGFDWVLNRILAGERPGRHEITGMGVGGLLAEIPSRPRPRELAERQEKAPVVALVVLAAGRARRMGPDGRHKLLAEFGGAPLVRRTVEAALEVRPAPVVVVVGHRADEVEAALDGLSPRIVRNPDFAAGMSTSLRCGLAAVESECDGMMVVLADMPNVGGAEMRRLVDAFVAQSGRAIVRASSAGKRGNPVILPKAAFEAVRTLTGDVGARHIVETSGLDIVDVDLGPAAHLDVDTPEAIVAAGGILKG